MRLAEGIHLSYCTNIHPGNDWPETFESLKAHVPKVRKGLLGPEGEFGLGLRLSDRAASELLEPGRLDEFKEWLKSHRVYVFTINGFPFGNFHGEEVKDRVHQPDWTHRSRLDYTLKLVRILSQLLPEGMDGSISTSPLSYRHWHQGKDKMDQVKREAADHLCELAEDLEALERQEGVYIHIDLEPEPDGLLENSQEAIDFFSDYLLPMSRERTRERSEYDERAGDLVRRYICLCYDVCHFALAYEEPAASLNRLRRAGIGIGKLQLSAALALRKEDLQAGQDPWELMRTLSEPTYLHQVTQESGGRVVTYRDVPALLDEQPDFEELRAHFHVPLFSERLGAFRSTNSEIVKVLEYLKSHPVCSHLEVETYTWEVLPPELKVPLDESIVREIEWCRERITNNAQHE